MMPSRNPFEAMEGVPGPARWPHRLPGCSLFRRSAALVLLLAPACTASNQEGNITLTQPGPGLYQELSWSPDGSSILVSVLDLTDRDPRYTYRIWKLDPEAGTGGPITEGPRDYWTSWSPSGTRVVFAAPGEGGALDVFTMDADGAGRERLTFDERDDTQPSWSPTGSQIAFISQREGDGQLWVMEPDGSNPRPLLRTRGEAQNPSWSPDASLIAYYEMDDQGGNWVSVVRSDGSQPKRVTEGLWPSWTPDGLGLLYSADGGLFRIPLDGGEPVLVIGGDVIAGELSPAGHRLAYIVREEGRVALEVADPDGQNRRTLMTRPAPEW